MEFDKKKFSDLMVKAKGNRSLNQFATSSGVSVSHFSRLVNCLIDTPPSATTIKKIADAAYNEVSYREFLQAAGHLEDNEDSGLVSNDLVQYWKDRAIKAEEDLHLLKLRLKQLIQ